MWNTKGIVPENISTHTFIYTRQGVSCWLEFSFNRRHLCTDSNIQLATQLSTTILFNSLEVK